MLLRQSLTTALQRLPAWRCCWPLAIGAGRPGAQAQGGDEIVVQAREALRTKDRARLAAARQAVGAAGHPLALWVDYWELSNRLGDAQQAELDAFYARWPGTYVEDRLRNDWLLELGRRRDWANFRVEFPRFRMNDDREVTCYALLTQHLAGQDVRDAARERLVRAARRRTTAASCWPPRCSRPRSLKPADAWHKARLAIEMQPAARGARRRGARAPRLRADRGRDRRQPGALAATPAAPWRRRLGPRTGIAGADATGRQRPAKLPPACCPSTWAERLPKHLTATAWAARRPSRRR